MKVWGVAAVLVLGFVPVIVKSENEEYDYRDNQESCTGFLLIPDRLNNRHKIETNRSTLDFQSVKEDILKVEGTCCFALFSSGSGAGSTQHLDTVGDHRLELDTIGSIYLVTCDTGGIHPILQFF